MKACNFAFFTILLLCAILTEAFGDNCGEIVKLVKKQCKRYSHNLEGSCVERRLKRSLYNTTCQSICDVNEDVNKCLQPCTTKCEETRLNVHSGLSNNVSTVINVHNAISNHNKINQPAAVQTSLLNFFSLTQTYKETKLTCCQILVPKCRETIYHQNLCSLELTERCGKICETTNSNNPYYPQPFFYNYYPRKCISWWPYHCYFPQCTRYEWCQYPYHWYNNYYPYYNWWNLYGEYQTSDKADYKTDLPGATTIDAVDESFSSGEANKIQE